MLVGSSGTREISKTPTREQERVGGDDNPRADVLMVRNGRDHNRARSRLNADEERGVNVAGSHSASHGMKSVLLCKLSAQLWSGSPVKGLL